MLASGGEIRNDIYRQGCYGGGPLIDYNDDPAGPLSDDDRGGGTGGGGGKEGCAGKRPAATPPLRRRPTPSRLRR